MMPAAFRDENGDLVSVSQANPLPVTGGGGGGGGGDASAANQVLTNTKLDNLQALVGTATAPVITDPAAAATIIGLLKGILTTLQAIQTNTETVLVDEGA